jgi:hypothetical protein
MCGHVPAPKSDEHDWNETADDPADRLSALGSKFAAEAGAQLPADEPAKCAANDEADNSENGRAHEQSDVIPGNSRANADSKQTTSRTDSSASEGSYVGFTKGGRTHQGEFSTNHTFHTNDTNDTNEIDGQKFENRNAKLKANPNPNSLNLNFATEGEDRQPTRRERALQKGAEGFFALY